jgi:PAS domain S-box-containing protein
MVVRSSKKRNVGPEGRISPLNRKELQVETPALLRLGLSLRTAVESALRRWRGYLHGRERVGNAVAAAILKCSYPAEIPTRSLRELIRSAGMDAGVFYLEEIAGAGACDTADGRLTLMCREGFSSEAKGDLASIATGEGLVGRVYARGEVVAGELRSFPRADALPWFTLGFRSFVGLPVCSGDRILGVLVLLGRRGRVFYKFTLKELSAAGCVVGEALQKARVHKEMEDALLAARRLSRLPQELEREVSTDKGLEGIAQAACEAALALSSMIVLVDAEGRPVRRASFGYSRKAAAAAARTDAVSARCQAMGQSVAISTPAEIRQALGDEVLEAGFASCICLPLGAGEQPLGTLWLNYESSRRFSELETEQLQGLAHRVAAAIKTAHRQALTLGRLARQRELIGGLERIASCKTVKQTLQALSDAACELLAARTALAACSRGERSEQAVSVAAYGNREQATSPSAPRSPDTAAIQERASQLMPPAGSEASGTDGENVRRAPGLLAKRLFDEANGSLGLLIVADKMGEADFSDEDAEWLDVLGRHGSAAIQNAVKTETAGAAAEQYRALLDHAPVAIATLDKNQTLTSVNRAFEQLSGFPREELEGKSALFDLLPEMERKGTADGGRGDRDDSAVRREVEVLLVTKTGGQKKVKLSIGTAHNSGSVTVCLAEVSPLAQRETEETAPRSAVSATASSVLSALKQPLAAAIGQLQSLLQHNPPENLRNPLETTCEQTQVCRAALEGLIVLTETEAMAEEPLSLNELVTSVVDEESVSLRRDGIGVGLRLDASLPVIRGDAARLRWALVELLESSCLMPRDVQQDRRLTIQTERVGDSGRLILHVTQADVPDENPTGSSKRHRETSKTSS